MFLLFAVLSASPAFAGAICADGWHSDSEGSGTCSSHGGVAAWTADEPPAGESDRDQLARIIALPKFQAWATSNGFEIGHVVPPQPGIDYGPDVLTPVGIYVPGPDDMRAMGVAQRQIETRPVYGGIHPYLHPQMRTTPVYGKIEVIREGAKYRGRQLTEVLNGRFYPMWFGDPLGSVRFNGTLYTRDQIVGEPVITGGGGPRLTIWYLLREGQYRRDAARAERFESQ